MRNTHISASKFQSTYFTILTVQDRLKVLASGNKAIRFYVILMDYRIEETLTQLHLMVCTEYNRLRTGYRG